MIDQTPISQHNYPGNLHHFYGTAGNQAFTPSAVKMQVEPVSEEQLVARLKKLMKMNLKNYCYQDAIFYADKIMHLQQSRSDKFVKAVYELGNFHSPTLIIHL